MPYYLDNTFLLDNPWITVVGCGGTGGFVAEGLCRLFQGRDATIVLVDHDRVEPPQPAPPEFLSRRRGRVQEQGPGRPAGKGLPASHRLLGLSLPGGGPAPGQPLPRPFLPRRPGHRLRRQRCRKKGNGRVPAGRPLPLGSSTPATTPTGGRCWSETWPSRCSWRNRPSPERPCHLAPAPTLQRPDLLTAVSTRPPDVDCATASGPHRPGPHHQPDDGVAGLAGGAAHGGGHLPLPGPLPGHGPGHRQPQLRHPGGGGAAGGTAPT